MSYENSTLVPKKNIARQSIFIQEGIIPPKIDKNS